VAAMPSITRIKKLSVLGVAAASLGVSASSASAGEVWVWACHGPAGGAAGQAFGGSDFLEYGDGCGKQADSLDAGGVRASLVPGADGIPFGQRVASLNVPTDTKLTEVRVLRRVTGAVPGVNYTFSAGGATLESASGADVPVEEKTFAVGPDANPSTVSFNLSCTANPCAATGPANLDVGRVGMKLTDTIAPTMAVAGYRSPAADENPSLKIPPFELQFAVADRGVGVKEVSAWISHPAGGGPTYVGPVSRANCSDIVPGPGVELAYGNDCATGGTVTLPVRTKDVPDGEGYTINYKVVDWAGNETVESRPITILNTIDLGSATQTLSIGTSGTSPQGAQSPAPGGTGGVAGQSASSCSSPRLSFSLTQKPLRRSKGGTPVLQSGKRYRFKGRLTCVVNGKRVSAPKRTRVDILNKVGKKTYRKTGTTVREKGRLTVILAYKTSRIITFRFTNTDNKRSSVSIRVQVAKKPTKK
jgi:hypothetical protein